MTCLVLISSNAGLPNLENVIVLPFVGSKDEVNLEEIRNRYLYLDLCNHLQNTR